MRVPPLRELALNMNGRFGNPLHLLQVEHIYLVVQLLILEIRGTEIPSEKHQQHFVAHTGLLLPFLRLNSLNLRGHLPSAFCGVEGVVISQDDVVVAAVDDDFVPVSHHVVKGPGIRQHFFDRALMKFMDVDFGEGMHELLPHLASEDVDVIPDVAHGVALHFFIRDIALEMNFFPLEVLAVGGRGGDDFAGSPPSGGADSVAVEDNVVVEGAELIDDGGILFIDDVLLSNFKFELEASILPEWEIDHTALRQSYFSSQPFRLL